MPTQTYGISAYDNLGRHYWKLYVSRGWQTSPRVGGRLLLQTLPYTSVKTEVYQLQDDSYTMPTGFTGLPEEYWDAVSEAQNQAYARFRGKLYQGSAALGVTLATYQQSRQMIVARARTITTEATELAARALGSRRPHRDIADMILEGLFGWKPLLCDIHAAATSVIHSAPSSGKFSATGRSFFEHKSDHSDPHSSTHVMKQGEVSIRHVANCLVENPNKWLAERAGLNNPAVVAWDLVPWSFVVNMFVNTGALVQSITDFAGLSFNGESTTEKNQCSETRVYTFDRSVYGYSGGTLRAFEKAHWRTVGSPLPPPTLEFRIPEANWELAAIACSLMVQKVRTVGNILQKMTN